MFDFEQYLGFLAFLAIFTNDIFNGFCNTLLDRWIFIRNF